MLKILRILLLTLLFTCKFATASTLGVKRIDAEYWTNTKGQELLQALSEKDIQTKYNNLDKMMTDSVNLDYVSKFVIGKYGRLMSNEQKSRYNNLFHRYVLSLYKQINIDFNTNDITFSIDDIIEHKNFTTVSCSVDAGKIIENISTDNSPKIPVKFKLIQNNNKIQAVDLEISNVSLVIEYRKQFYRMIKEEDEDIDWFLDKFNDKVIANEKAFYKKAGM